MQFQFPASLFICFARQTNNHACQFYASRNIYNERIISELSPSNSSSKHKDHQIMGFINTLNIITRLGTGLVSITVFMLVGCGGGGSSSSSGNNALTPAEIAAITPAQIATYKGSQIAALGANISYLSDATLGALSHSAITPDPGQIQSISAIQIAALTPAQVRLIGSTGHGGATTTSQIKYLNSGTWAALASDSAQVAAITPAEIATLTGANILALGTNITFLSDAALGALSSIVITPDPGQIGSISAAQIAVMSPAQVRMIGSTGAGGATTTSKIRYLNSGAWAALASDSAQVAAITPDEITTLTGDEVLALGANIRFLSDASLGALTTTTCSGMCASQIASISAAQITVLSPAQVRMIGSTGAGGATTTSQIKLLNSGTWATLVSDPAQVAAITPAEIATLSNSEIIAFDTNISYLSDAALGALTTTTCSGFCASQIESITATQIAVLSPMQVGNIAGIATGYWGAGTGISLLNLGTFGSLVAAQVAVLTPTNVLGVTAAQLASLTETAIAGLSPATIASLTVTQKSLLSTAQHTACGC